MTINRCQACDAVLLWAITPAGKRMPLDPRPTDDGTVLVLQPHGLGEKLAITLSRDGLKLARKHNLPLHLSHHATCTDPGRFRS